MWIVVLISGLLLIVIPVFSILKGRKSKSWPSTQAEVTGTEVEIKQDYDEDGTHTYFYPRVYYQYRVDEMKYQGNKIKLLEASTTRRKAQAFIADYQPGDQMTVFYNPEKPEEAVMVTGEQKYLYIMVVIGIAIIIFSIFKLLS